MYLCASIAQFPERGHRPTLTCIRHRILILWKSCRKVVRLPGVLTKLPSYTALDVESLQPGYGSSRIAQKPFIICGQIHTGEHARTTSSSRSTDGRSTKERVGRSLIKILDDTLLWVLNSCLRFQKHQYCI